MSGGKFPWRSLFVCSLPLRSLSEPLKRVSSFMASGYTQVPSNPWQLTCAEKKRLDKDNLTAPLTRLILQGHSRAMTPSLALYIIGDEPNKRPFLIAFLNKSCTNDICYIYFTRSGVNEWYIRGVSVGSCTYPFNIPRIECHNKALKG